AAVCLETLEHLPENILDGYLKHLSRIAKKLFVSVPYERGIPFLAKYAIKTAFFGGYVGPEKCSLHDVAMLALGKTQAVKRCDHKGFDERLLIQKMSKYLSIERVESILPPMLPRSLSLTVGIVATPTSPQL